MAKKNEEIKEEIVETVGDMMKDYKPVSHSETPSEMFVDFGRTDLNDLRDRVNWLLRR